MKYTSVRKYKRTVLIRSCMGIVLSFFTTFLWSQQSTSIKEQIDSIYSSKNSYDIKIALTKELFSKVDSTTYSKDLGYIYHKLGLLFKRNKEYEKAIAIIQKAIVVRKSLDTIDTYALSNSKYNLSIYQGLSGQYKEQLATLEEIITDNFPTKFTYRAYIELAELLSNKGDYYTSFQYLQKVIDSYNNYKDALTLANTHSQFIRIYALMEESQKNLEEIEFHKGQLDSLYGGGTNLTIANNLAVIYEDVDQVDKAITEYKKVLDIYENREDPENIAAVYNNLGRMYARKGKHMEADLYFSKALKIAKDPSIIAMTYDNQGYYLQTNKSIHKVEYYFKAIHTLLGNSATQKLPSFEKIKSSEYKLDILNYLIDVAEVLVVAYDEEKQKNYLTSAEETLFLIDQLVSLIRFDSTIEQSKLFWIRKSVNTYMLGVRVSYLLNHVENGFYFMEKNKALLLLENLSGIVEQPKISNLEESVQKHVNTDTNFIEYILNDQEGYAIFCTLNKRTFFKIPNVPTLSKQLLDYRQLVSRPIVKKETLVDYNETAATLFSHLFSFEGAFDQLKGKNLLVIPDYTLQNIPFEALKPTLESDFLIRDVTISYLQSASVFNALNQSTKTAPKRVLAVAPVDFQDQQLISLSGAKEGIAQISDLYAGDELLKEKASKEGFTDLLAKYRLLHLNTHAGFDSIQKTPWIAFYDKKLSLNEIYALENNAELIVLDACKSADGSLEIGEGVMSLARGFFYNGTKSIIAAQWNSNEKSSNEILVHFYKALQQGNDKASALREAKLNYINTHQLSERSPYYWASLCLTGNVETIDLTIPFYLRIELWGAVLILFFILFSMKRRKNEI